MPHFLDQKSGLLPIASCLPPLVRGVRGDSSCLLPVPDNCHEVY
ncbi:hypothetical protein [Moorena sp. SIOASIH]|nr:hypothetical protein [Moorena sp. SIOASIH]